MGEGTYGIKSAFKGGVGGDGGLEANSMGSGVSLSNAVAERTVHGRV